MVWVPDEQEKTVYPGLPSQEALPGPRNALASSCKTSQVDHACTDMGDEDKHGIQRKLQQERNFHTFAVVRPHVLKAACAAAIASLVSLRPISGM